MVGPAVDPTKQTAIGIFGEILINRQDYGISFSRLMDNGKLFIGNEVKISIHALALLPRNSDLYGKFAKSTDIF
jgi:polyisoprenoid-binding protein YceI